MLDKEPGGLGLVPAFINSVHLREPQFSYLRMRRLTLLESPRPVLVSDDVCISFAAEEGGKQGVGRGRQVRY